MKKFFKYFFATPFVFLSLLFALPSTLFLGIAYMIHGNGTETMSEWMNRCGW